LRELSKAKLGTEQGQLRDAIDLDTASVGTIHILLTDCFDQAGGGGTQPSYEIAEDDQALIHETFEPLLQAVQSGTLAAELKTPLPTRREVTQTILDALDVGLRADSLDFGIYCALRAR
jgi:hypothetical protein